MTSEDSSSIKTSTSPPAIPSPRGRVLIVVLVAAAALTRAFYFDLEDPRRVVLALAALGFLFAPMSERALRPWLFAVAVAALGWGGTLAASEPRAWWLWMLCAVTGAFLAVRGGSRAAAFYLPGASEGEPERQQRTIRRQLQLSGVAFLVVFVLDGEIELYPMWRASILFLSALLFLRFFLLQGKYLKLAARPLDPAGLVPAQRVPLLLVMFIGGATPYLDRLLPESDVGPLLVSSMLLLVLAGLLFVLAVIRLGWPRPAVRKASFLAGMALALALAAALVELEAWGTYRFTFFSTACTAVLVVLPFAHSTTRLFEPYPKLATVIPTTMLSVMCFPVTAMNGARWSLSSSGFLFAFAILVLLYHLVVAWRERRVDSIYLLSSLAVLGALFGADIAGWTHHPSAWKMFFLSLCFVLAAVEFLERSHRVAPAAAP